MEPRRDSRIAHGPKPEPHDPFPRRIAQDERLTPEALGLLAHLYSRPPDWEIWVSQIDKWAGWGRDKRQAVLGLLVSLGYLELVKGGHVHGSYYRMTQQASLIMLDPENRKIPPSASPEDRETRLSDPSEDRKNRQSENPTAGKSGPIQIQDSNTELDLNTDPPLPPPATEGWTWVNWAFLGEDVKFAPRALDLLTQYPEDYEAMWRSVFGQTGSPGKLAVLYASAGDIMRFACGVAITEVGSRIPGKAVDYMEAVLKNMRPTPPRRDGKSTRKIPNWVRLQAEHGYLSLTAKELCVNEFNVPEYGFTEMPPAPGSSEPMYRIEEEAAGHIFA